MCLTCTACNAGASASLDQAAAMMNREMSGQGTRVRLNVFGTEHTTYFVSDSVARARLARLVANNPAAEKFESQLRGREIRLLTEMKRGPAWDPNKGLTLRIMRPPRNRVEVSWVRSAYLMVFSLLGQGGVQICRKRSDPTDTAANCGAGPSSRNVLSVGFVNAVGTRERDTDEEECAVLLDREDWRHWRGLTAWRTGRSPQGRERNAGSDDSPTEESCCLATGEVRTAVLVRTLSTHRLGTCRQGSIRGGTYGALEGL